MTRRIRLRAFLVAGIVVAACLAFFVSPWASGAPDGLNRVAIDEGFAATEAPNALDDVPTAGYSVRGVDDEGLSTGLAGVIGVAATFAVTAGVFLAVRARRPSERPRPVTVPAAGR